MKNSESLESLPSIIGAIAGLLLSGTPALTFEKDFHLSTCKISGSYIQNYTTQATVSDQFIGGLHAISTLLLDAPVTVVVDGVTHTYQSDTDAAIDSVIDAGMVMLQSLNVDDNITSFYEGGDHNRFSKALFNHLVIDSMKTFFNNIGNILGEDSLRLDYLFDYINRSPDGTMTVPLAGLEIQLKSLTTGSFFVDKGRHVYNYRDTKMAKISDNDNYGQIVLPQVQHEMLYHMKDIFDLSTQLENSGDISPDGLAEIFKSLSNEVYYGNIKDRQQIRGLCHSLTTVTKDGEIIPFSGWEKLIDLTKVNLVYNLISGVETPRNTTVKLKSGTSPFSKKRERFNMFLTT